MFVWGFVQQAKLHDKMCVHLCKLNKETLAMKLCRLLSRVCGSSMIESHITASDICCTIRTPVMSTDGRMVFNQG